jgi:purine-binding chemotaxis protein CheW
MEQDTQDMQDAQKDKYVTFMSGKECFGLKIEYVNEIIVLQEITKVPESEEYVKGLINLRGKIIPVIDVRLRFHQEPIEYNDRTCIIVVNVQSTTVGLIVEKITEVVEINDDNLLPAPVLNREDQSHVRYVYAIGKVGDSVKLLLDPEKLINEEELGTLEKMSKEKEKENDEEE